MLPTVRAALGRTQMTRLLRNISRPPFSSSLLTCNAPRRGTSATARALSDKLVPSFTANARDVAMSLPLPPPPGTAHRLLI